MKRGLGIYAAAIFAFLHLPLVTLAVFSFNSSRFTVWEGFSLRWYQATFRDPQLAEGTWNSIVIAFWSRRHLHRHRNVCAYALMEAASRVITARFTCRW